MPSSRKEKSLPSPWALGHGGYLGIDELQDHCSSQSKLQFLSSDKSSFFLSTVHKICIHFSREIMYLWQISFLLEQKKCHILADCCLGIPPYSFSIVPSPTFPWNILRCPEASRVMVSCLSSALERHQKKQLRFLCFLLWLCFVLFGKHC